MLYRNSIKKTIADADASDTLGMCDNYSINDWLQSLLDEEIYTLIKIDYYKGIEKALKNAKFKKLFEKTMENSNNKYNRTFTYWKTVQCIEKEVIRRWINAKERNIAK